MDSEPVYITNLLQDKTSLHSIDADKLVFEKVFQRRSSSVAKSRSSLSKSFFLNATVNNETAKIFNLLKRNSVSNTSSGNTYSGSEVKAICMRIFMNYSKISKDDEQFYISYQTTFKLLKAMNLIDEKELTSNQLEILLKKIQPGVSTLNSEQFMDLISKIAAHIDPDFANNPQKSVIILVKNFLEPYAKIIESNTEYSILNQSNAPVKGERSSSFVSRPSQNFATIGDKYNLTTSSNNISTGCFHQTLEKFVENFSLDEKTRRILNSVTSGLKEVYLSYFHYEVNAYRDPEKISSGSYENLIQFCKDFEIVPYLTSLNQISIYWNIVINMTSEMIINNTEIPLDKFFDNTQLLSFGSLFTFFKFCMMVIHLSILSHNKYHAIYSENATDNEKLIYFLEKLHASVGFKNFWKRLNRPYNDKMTLLPDKDLVTSLNPKIIKRFSYAGDMDIKELTSITIGERKTSLPVVDVEVMKNFNKNSENFTVRDILAISDEVYVILYDQIDKLREIFQDYSKIGEKLNYGKLGYTSFQKFLQDSNLMEYSSETQGKTKRGSFVRYPTTKNSHLQTVRISKSHLNTTPIKKLKLNEIDVNLIFSNISGNKNFDNRGSILRQFDKNKGYIVKIGSEGTPSTVIDKSNVLRNNNTAMPFRMDFNLFIKSFELIALKLYPDSSNLDQAMTCFLKEHLPEIIKNYNERTSKAVTSIEEMLEDVRKEEMCELLKDLSNLIAYHYQNYCDVNGLLSFEKVIEFFKDFELYPKMISLVHIKGIFYKLVEEFASQSIINEDSSQIHRDKDQQSCSSHEVSANKLCSKKNKLEKINFYTFLEILAITALNIKYDDGYTKPEKVLYLIDKMNHSDGINKSHLKSGQTFSAAKDFTYYMNIIKEKYPQFYAKNEKKESFNIRQVKFNTIFKDDF